MGRKKGSIWSRFREIHVDGVKRAKCKKCWTEFVNNAARMEKHVEKGCTAPENLSESSSEEQPRRKSLKQTTLGMVTTTSGKQHSIDLQVTRYLIASNAPFNAVAQPHFQKLVTELRPGTVLPNRMKVAGELLDEVYGEEKTKLQAKVRGGNATLSIDGWSTLTNEPVLGVCFYTAGMCILVNTLSTMGEAHTSDYLLEIVKEQIQYVESEFEVKITSVVTDNAANMCSMRRKLADSGTTHTYGCHAHIANLLSKDILNNRDMKPILTKIVDVIKFLRNSHAASAEISRRQMRRPPIPCETRWNTYVDVIEYFIEFWAKIAEIVWELCKPTDLVCRIMDQTALRTALSW